MSKRGGWQTQEKVYLVMWKSKKSGGTYSELRKTDYGLDQLLRTLAFLGVPEDDIVVTEEKKKWMPESSTRKLKNEGKGILRVGTGDQSPKFAQSPEVQQGAKTTYLQ